MRAQNGKLKKTTKLMKLLNVISWVGAIGVASSLAIVMPAFAQTSVGVSVQGGIHGVNGDMWHGDAPHGVVGTVSAVSGTTLTVTTKAKEKNDATSAAPTVYTVDASNAKIYNKGNEKSTIPVSSIAVGDAVMVRGTVSGTNVTATVIRDGIARDKFKHSVANLTQLVKGNGEPIVGGSVVAISGTTFTVTNASNVTYTIDAASTTVVKNGTSTAIGNIAVGDNVLVQGTVNGSSVTAYSIIDQGARNTNSSSTNASSSKARGNGFGLDGGFFGAIGGFFRHLFGF